MRMHRFQLAAVLATALVTGSGIAPAGATAATSLRLAVLIAQSSNPWSAERVASYETEIFGPDSALARRFAEVGRTMTGAVLGPVRISTSYESTCNPDSIAYAALRKARTNGIGLSDYDFVAVVYQDQRYRCDWGGIPIDYRTVLSAYADPAVYLHEIGHLLDFYGHANGLACSSKRDYRAIPGTRRGCRSLEYKDGYSVMGAAWGSVPTFGFDAWRGYYLSKALVGAPGRIPGRGGTLTLAYLDDQRGLAPHWATLALAKGWRLSLELSRGHGDSSWCTRGSSSSQLRRTVYLGGSSAAADGCGPAVAFRLLPPDKPFGRSHLIAAIPEGGAFHDRKRDWTLAVVSIVDGIATVAVGDATAPAAPTGVSATAGPSDGYGDSCSLAWQPVSEPEVTYEVGFGSRVVAWTSDLAWTGWMRSTDALGNGLCWSVRSVDRYGNASAWSAPAPIPPMMEPTPEPTPIPEPTPEPLP